METRLQQSLLIPWYRSLQNERIFCKLTKHWIRKLKIEWICFRTQPIFRFNWTRIHWYIFRLQKKTKQWSRLTLRWIIIQTSQWRWLENSRSSYSSKKLRIMRIMLGIFFNRRIRRIIQNKRRNTLKFFRTTTRWLFKKLRKWRM